MAKSPIYTTMQLIADILSFRDNQDMLSEQLKHSVIDWNQVVVVGSRHLMLPALYCRLKEKKLLPLLPEDLNLYLKEIADINRGRNEILLKEAYEVSEILNKENIEHVFIKGVAHLAGHTFKDFAERMVGDIDILVAQNQIHRAFDLLYQNGYTETVDYNYKPKNVRHLSRQISSQKFGAIELHSEILLDNYKNLIVNEQVLKNKRIINGVAVPSIEDAIKIAILALQINDKAHVYGNLGFKTIYDCLALHLPSDQVLLTDLSMEKHAQSFLHIANVFFKELKPRQSSNYSTLLKRYFILRLNYPKLGKLISYLLNGSVNIQLRLSLLVSNKSYRRHIIKNKILNKNVQEKE